MVPTFWRAFPFASLVFALVATMMIMDLMSEDRWSKQHDTLWTMAHLGLYMVSALVTGIVVLYGAHLVEFEGQVRTLTSRTSNAIKQINQTEKNLKGLRGDLTDMAGHIGAMLLAELSQFKIRADLQRYRQDSDHPYLRSMAYYAYLAHRACDGQPSEIVTSVMANVLTPYLQEEAFDYGQRKLVTNARNYTGFLVGSADGFLNVLDDLKRGSITLPGIDRKNVGKLRVLFLTHTVVHPTLLLNWPRSEWDAKINFGCVAVPFMFEYMTWCRFFSANEQFLHGRLLSLEGIEEKMTSKMPYRVKKADLLKGTFAAAKCDPWGVPMWRQGGKSKDPRSHFAYFNPTYSRRLQNALVLTEDHLLERFICYPYPPRDSFWNTGPDACWTLTWPIFTENCKVQQFERPVISGVLEFVRESVKAMRTGNYSGSPCVVPFDSFRGILDTEQAVLTQELSVALESIEKGIDMIDSGTDLDAVKSLLEGLKGVRGIQWCLQQGDQVGQWDEFRTSVLLVCNYLLARAKQPELANDTPVDVSSFPDWFAETFHSYPELHRHYTPEDDAPKEGLGDKEFAFIGLIETDADRPTNQQVAGALRAFKAGEEASGCRIHSLMALESSIDSPWEHAEVKWFPPARPGFAEPDVKSMIEWYAKHYGAP
ncbi:MAG: hypothetical protein HYV26_06420 [Candidatus Hydrogenedentes bacterium]|nr:hypothetical protein [Candidatus Hydrogenedentota bacterium]